MADSFTSSFGLVLPEVGASSDTWGDKLNGNTAEIDKRLLPDGAIIPWYGDVLSPPDGWAVCDGTNGTPDLRDRFVVGAGQNYDLGDTGGEDSVTLSTSELPSHNHSGSTNSTGAHNHGGSTGGGGGHSHSASSGSAGGHTHSGSTNTTGSHTHNYESTGESGSTMYLVQRRNSGASPVNSSVKAAGNHSHSLNINSAGSHSHSISVGTVGDHNHSISSDGGHSHTLSVDNTGGGESHENRPPYYALVYIMLMAA